MAQTHCRAETRLLPAALMRPFVINVQNVRSVQQLGSHGVTANGVRSVPGFDRP